MTAPTLPEPRPDDEGRETDCCELAHRSMLLALVRCIVPAIKAGEVTDALRHQVKRLAATYDGEFSVRLAQAIIPREPDPNEPKLVRSDSEYERSFAEVVAKRCSPEESLRLHATLAEQMRALPEQVAAYSLIRAMADRLASVLPCPVCECRMFVGFHEHDTEEDDGPICPVCKPAAALHYLRIL